MIRDSRAAFHFEDIFIDKMWRLFSVVKADSKLMGRLGSNSMCMIASGSSASPRDVPILYYCCGSMIMYSIPF